MTTPQRNYLSEHELTETYIAGMLAMAEGRLQEAFDLLASEPPQSPCFGLAQGNAAMVLHRLDRYQQAEQLAKETLVHLARDGCPHPPSWVFTKEKSETCRIPMESDEIPIGF